MNREFESDPGVTDVSNGSDGEYTPLPTPLIVYSQSNRGLILLKDETKQIGGSFKTRGARHFVLRNSRGCDRFVAASTGNHAIGLACACREIGMECTIFVPESCPKEKREKISALDVDLRLTGTSFEACERAALKYSEAPGRRYAPSFDHIDVIDGHSSIFREVDRQYTGQLDCVYVPVGGGGLFAAAARNYRGQTTEVVGVEFDDYRRIDEILAGRTSAISPKKLTYPPSLEGILVSSIGSVPRSVLAGTSGISTRQVSLAEMQRTRLHLERLTGIRAELAAVAGLVAAYRDSLASVRTRLCVLTGGNCA